MLKNRRSFIKKIGAASALAIVGPAFVMKAKSDLLKITVLHTNDLHSQIDAYDNVHPKYPGMGGFAKREALVNKIRKEEEHVLLLDAGDLFQGSPYFNFFKGELEIKLMNRLGYDAMTIGNHEFDNGSEMLFEQLKKAEYPVLSANYKFEEAAWRQLVKPFVIKKFGSVKVGIVGVSIDPAGLISPKNFTGITYEDAISTANEISLMLKSEEACDFVIALTHLGIDIDEQLAKKSKDIDMIVGGHTHTFLEEPMMIPNMDGHNVIINQMGWAGVYLGRIDLYFSNKLEDLQSERIN